MSDKEYTPLALWAMFLGVFGAHRFYAGKTGTAILMLVLTFTFIGLFATMIWSFVDRLYIHSGQFTDADGNEIKQPGNSPDKGLGTASILAMFFAQLGVHRYYAGKIGTGVLMTLLTISLIGYPITAIWALVDNIYLAMGKFTDADGNEIGHLDAYGARDRVFD